MKRRLFKRLISGLLSVLILSALVYVQVGAAPVAEFKLSASKTYIKANESFDIKVKLSNADDLKLNGLTLALKYDKNVISYSNKSAKALVDGMDEFTAHNSNGTVIFTWDSLENAVIPAGNSDIIKFSFQALSDFSATSVTMQVNSLYYLNGNKITDIQCTVGSALSLNQLVSSAVQSVINRINAIPQPVTYTPDCGAKITAAWNEYCALPAQSKTAVTNYNVLVAAMKEYERLSAEQGTGNTELDEYKRAHEYALSLTKLNATTDKDADGKFKDIEAIKIALSDMEKLSIATQAKLMTSKNTLKDVLQYLEKQVEDEIKQQEEEKRIEEQKQAAKEAVEDFKSQPFKWVFDLTVDTVKVTDETGVSNAMTALNSAEINKYAIEMLKEYRELLEALSKRIVELKVAENPEMAKEIIAAEDFKSKFSSILALTVDNVTKDDELDINIASYAFEMLDDGVKALLEAEGEHIAALLEKVSNLPDSEETDTDDNDAADTTEIEEHDESPSIIQKVINKIIGGKDYDVTIQNRNMSKFIWVMLIAIGALSINLGVCYGFYKYAEKKYERGCVQR